MADQKTAEQLQAEIDLRDCLEKERKESNDAYAEKRVQIVVYGGLALLAAAIITGLVTLFFTHVR